MPSECIHASVSWRFLTSRAIYVRRTGSARQLRLLLMRASPAPRSFAAGIENTLKAIGWALEDLSPAEQHRTRIWGSDCGVRAMRPGCSPVVPFSSLVTAYKSARLEDGRHLSVCYAEVVGHRTWIVKHKGQ